MIFTAAWKTPAGFSTATTGPAAYINNGNQQTIIYTKFLTLPIGTVVQTIGTLTQTVGNLSQKVDKLTDTVDTLVKGLLGPNGKE